MELVPNKLYFTVENQNAVWSKSFPRRRIMLDELYRVKKGRHYGVPSIQSIFVHCSEVDRRLKEYDAIVYVTNNERHRDGSMSRTLSALFMGAYAVLRLEWKPRYTIQQINYHITGKFMSFRDYHGDETYGLCILDCLEALKIGVHKHGWFERETARQIPRSQDMNWIIPNKVIAMKDPRKNVSENSKEIDKDCIAELKRQSINTIVRLNTFDSKGNIRKGIPYDSVEMTNQGFRHEDIPFKDCGIPSNRQVRKFLELISDPEVKVAVHCHAGLGRTGTMIACYLISNFSFTSRQAVAWLNMCRRGSVMGRQHQFLDSFCTGQRSLKKSQGSTMDTECISELTGNDRLQIKHRSLNTIHQEVVMKFEQKRKENKKKGKDNVFCNKAMKGVKGHLAESQQRNNAAFFNKQRKSKDSVEERKDQKRSTIGTYIDKSRTERLILKRLEGAENPAQCAPLCTNLAFVEESRGQYDSFKNEIEYKLIGMLRALHSCLSMVFKLHDNDDNNQSGHQLKFAIEET